MRKIRRTGEKNNYLCSIIVGFSWPSQTRWEYSSEPFSFHSHPNNANVLVVHVDIVVLVRLTVVRDRTNFLPCEISFHFISENCSINRSRNYLKLFTQIYFNSPTNRRHFNGQKKYEPKESKKNFELSVRSKLNYSFQNWWKYFDLKLIFSVHSVLRNHIFVVVPRNGIRNTKFANEMDNTTM